MIGLGIGPLLVGPLSELYGRNIIYRVSFGAFFALSWPVAFAPDWVSQVLTFAFDWLTVANSVRFINQVWKYRPTDIAPG